MSGIRIVQGMDTSNTQQAIIANSSHLDFGDPVTLDPSTGFLRRTAATEKIEGFYCGASIDSASNNQTVGKVYGSYEPNVDQMVLEITANQAVTQANLGQYADVIVTTNAYTLSASTANTTGQLKIIDFDPNRDGTTTLARCQVAEPQRFGFVQS